MIWLSDLDDLEKTAHDLGSDHLMGNPRNHRKSSKFFPVGILIHVKQYFTRQFGVTQVWEIQVRKNQSVCVFLAKMMDVTGVTFKSTKPLWGGYYRN